MKTYKINEHYVSRNQIEFYDDTSNTDEWQDEVYQYARSIFDKNDFNSILDIGTGSGYKLCKYFEKENTLGIDLPETVKFLKEKYPLKSWISNFKEQEGYDLIICSDVIEHLLDPDELLSIISKSKPKMIILSTPDRSLISKEFQNGPPKNVSHVREWSFEEFNNYIGTYFQIIDHFISNYNQKTQVILAKLK